MVLLLYKGGNELLIKRGNIIAGKKYGFNKNDTIYKNSLIEINNKKYYLLTNYLLIREK
ncbi:hypothetical protein MPTP_1968 (plasmid) [Melissococcus plutonius ATCC 35311]|uniref:Uncharacterized protein n=1 Tax=Melissococcus plutonius (strain ATCC 35311 / DSM 29964 / CIP 104052 / LMG 20360 / NCIMB 702443) TaxID=940190 RepID=F3YCX7_MELPT|nr:hypothetical protein MPTP_1968 [Melissococcus plutonius ATCC 35311]BAL62950.1 hypothetical protein MPD5_1768 [Melissococcus plutonius DAT561]